ncbi:hypothetical protein GCM10022394_19150 [Zobellella aerophila]|uniref:Amino acid permease/ SLC12A domain-containing protein n=2 Tax=Zobellella aerophila TaxID=870480 RepID=A0ABP6VTQ0_9GAMM
MTGVGKGVKWLSNINLTPSFILLAVFILFGSTGFAFSTYIGDLGASRRQWSSAPCPSR